MRTTLPLRARAAGFTLVELLTVMAIIALLASLVTPGIQQMMARAESIGCTSNLRQIFVAAGSAAQDNDNRYPAIELDARNPIFDPEVNAHTMLEALSRYGVTEKVLQCRSDLKGGAESAFTKFGTSYQWEPVSEDENPTLITIYTPRGAFPGRLSRIRLCRDFRSVHPGGNNAGGGLRPNTLYADGHVREASAPIQRIR